MDAPAEPVLSIPRPPLVSESALYSFNPLVFLYFILAFYLVPYPIYRYVAKRYNWEVNNKTIARHWSDTMLGFSYGVILFIFGNYAHSMSWITVVAFYPSLFGYALIAELPFTKTSLPNIKNWPMGMWVVFLTALAIILAFAAVHIYFATLQVLPFVIYYVCGLLIPAFFLVTSILVKKEVNTNYCRTKFSRYRKWRSSKSKSSNEGNKDEEQGQEQQQVEQVHNPYQNTVSLHIHHWQIFYVLAFFTRYTHPVSQVASGIVIACYMQGICAYGYDALVNDD